MCHVRSVSAGFGSVLWKEKWVRITNQLEPFEYSCHLHLRLSAERLVDNCFWQDWIPVGCVCVRAWVCTLMYDMICFDQLHNCSVIHWGHDTCTYPTYVHTGTHGDSHILHTFLNYINLLCLLYGFILSFWTFPNEHPNPMRGHTGEQYSVAVAVSEVTSWKYIYLTTCHGAGCMACGPLAYNDWHTSLTSKGVAPHSVLIAEKLIYTFNLGLPACVCLWNPHARAILNETHHASLLVWRPQQC